MYIRCIRIILSVLLLYGVYTETGIWTTISFSLILIALELEAYLCSLLADEQKQLSKKLRS